MAKTKFVNGTSSVITLKEANSGIHTFVVKLEKQGDAKSSYDMELDANATYREYHLFNVISVSSADIVVSSDHLSDNKVITIMEVAPGVFSWEGTLRKDPPNKKPGKATDASIMSWLFNELSKWVSLSKFLAH